MTILWFLLKFLLLNKFMACFEYSLLLFCGYTHTRRIYDISFRLGHKRATPWNEIMVREKAELRGIIEREEQYYQLKIGKTAHLFLSSTVKLRKGKRTWCQIVKNLSLRQHLLDRKPGPRWFFHIILNISTRSCLVFD